MAGIRLVHTSDFHGHFRPEFASEIRALGGLYFDCGDLIRTGNLGVPLHPDPAWAHLKDAGCVATVLGNRETHPLEAAFLRKWEGASQPILVSNLDDPRFQQTLTIEANGIKVGVFGVMVPMATDRMKTAAAWSRRWENPITTAQKVARSLRETNDVVVALTHIGLTQDRMLAAACPEVDVILGGHSHSVLESPERCGNAWICHTGSHGRFVGVYEWDSGELRGELLLLTKRVP